MPVDPLLQLRGRLLCRCMLSAFAPAALIGNLGAGSTRDVVEDGGLEATPEPRHDVLGQLVLRGCRRRVSAECSKHWRYLIDAGRHLSSVVSRLTLQCSRSDPTRKIVRSISTLGTWHYICGWIMLDHKSRLTLTSEINHDLCNSMQPNATQFSNSTTSVKLTTFGKTDESL